MRYNPGRMIMHQCHGAGPGDHGGPENLPGVNQDRVQGPGCHQDVALDPAPGVEQQDHETFNLGAERRMADNMRSPVFRRPARFIAKVQGFGQGAFPQGNHLEFLSA